MPRIISGSARGRRFDVPPSGTRPTSDRVRESVFNLLAARIDFDDERVLDLYAGAGGLGIEALSRGARECRFVESNARAASVIEKNLRAVGLHGPAASVSRTSVDNLVAGPQSAGFSLVFIDPPYELPSDELGAVISAAGANGWLAPSAYVVVERSARSAALPEMDGFELVLAKTYGETSIHLLLWAP